MKNDLREQIPFIASTIVLVTCSRLSIASIIGHLPNFSAVNALALFCGAYFGRRLTAFSVMLLTVCLSDLWVNKILMDRWTLYYPGFYWQYISYFFITLLGTALKDKIKIFSLFLAASGSSLLFFVISNFGVWLGGMLYPLTFNGLVACYIAALPFFQNTLFSDLFFSLILFGSFGLLPFHKLLKQYKK